MGLGKFCNLNFLRIALAAVWKTEDHERNWMMGRELTEDTDLWGVCVCVCMSTAQVLLLMSSGTRFSKSLFSLEGTIPISKTGTSSWEDLEEGVETVHST